MKFCTAHLVRDLKTFGDTLHNIASPSAHQIIRFIEVEDRKLDTGTFLIHEYSCIKNITKS